MEFTTALEFKISSQQAKKDVQLLLTNETKDAILISVTITDINNKKTIRKGDQNNEKIRMYCMWLCL